MEGSESGPETKRVNAIWEGVQPRIYAFVYRRTGSKDTAKDVVQETFIKLWNHRLQLEEIRNPEAWCMTVAKNLIYDRGRRSKFESDTEISKLDHLQTSGQDIEKDLHRNNLVNAVKAIIEQLPDKQRQAIELRDMEELTYKEVAKQMKSSVHAVKVNIYRGRQAIKEQLIKIYRDEI